MPRRSLMIQVVANDTTEAALRAYGEADPRADVVELRLDAIKDLDLERLVRAPGKPKLLTIRSRQQGGAAAPAEREALLRRAHAAPVEYLDIEAGDEDLLFLRRAPGPKRVLAWHDLEATPFDLVATAARLLAVPGIAMVKIVTFADAMSDNLRVRELLRTAPRGRMIAFCMGPKGVPSRILAPFWGSAAVFAPRRGAPPSAPAQIPLEDLFEIYRSRTIGGRTRLLGVVGNPIGHSLSPLMHNTALEALDLDYRYVPFEPTTLAEFLPLLTDLRIAGLSVTIPYKEKILPYVDHLDAGARRTGAVNTICKVWNRLEGHNTDVEASVVPLRGRLTLRGARVAVMGAGGAARALTAALRRRGARVTVFGRTPSRAAELAGRLGAEHLPWQRLRRFPCDLLVNTTPVGLAPDSGRTPVPISWVTAPLVYDMIYNPGETTLLRQARARGAVVINGLEMFVAQGAAQFQLFTGREAPVDLMRRTVLDALAGQRPPPGGRRRPVDPRRTRARH